LISPTGIKNTFFTCPGQSLFKEAFNWTQSKRAASPEALLYQLRPDQSHGRKRLFHFSRVTSKVQWLLQTEVKLEL